MAWCALGLPSAWSAPALPDTEIEAELDRLLNPAFPDSAQRLELAMRLQRDIASRESPDIRLAARACFAVAYARHVNGMPALTTLTPCIDPRLDTVDRVLHLRTRTFLAWLQMAEGEVEQSLKSYEQLIAEDLSALDQAAVLSLRTAHGVSLHQAGQPLAAIEVLQATLQQALDADMKNSILGIGNNLVAILVERRMYRSAAAWLERLAPVYAGGLRGHIEDSLELHRLQMLGQLGQPEKAVAELLAYINQRSNSSPVNIGNAHEFRASFLLDLDRHDEALDAAQRAVKMLSSMPVETLDARLVLIEVLIETGAFDAALTELEGLGAFPSAAPSVRERAETLRFRAMLGKQAPNDLASAFDDIQGIRARYEQERIDQDTRYFDSKIELEKQRTQLAAYAGEQARLEAQAEQLGILASAERRARRLSGAVLLMVCGGLIVLIIQRNQRRTAMQLQQQAHDLNEQLKQEVAQKSAALRQQLGEQAELERSLAETRHNEAIGRITGNVAHDFNNLLQVISLCIEHIAVTSKTHDNESHVGAIRTALDHAKSIIRQLLAFARRQRLRHEPLGFSDYMAQTETLLRVAAGEQVSFKVSDQSSNAAIVADASGLTTAVLNLIANACEAMDEGGAMELSARVETLSTGTTLWPDADAGDYLAIRITDTGRGMSEDVVHSAFEPFFSKRADGAGVGLGLSSVYGFVKQSHGHIRIDSEPGQGTVVSLLFPTTRDLRPTAADETLPQIALDGLKLLVVEDNDALSRALRVMLESHQAKVEDARNAVIARQRLSEETFDIVLSDIRMQGKLDGYELYQWVVERKLETRVLLMTGYRDDALADESITILRKPFSERELFEALTQLLASH